MAVRWIYSKLFAPGKYYINARGLSKDEKPTENIVTGSTFVEIDTFKAFFFDEESGTWLKKKKEENNNG